MAERRTLNLRQRGFNPHTGHQFLGCKMHSVKIRRNELLGIVRENKEKHIKEFNEAVEDFKRAVIKISEENLALANSGDLKEIAKIKSVPQKPISYESSYTRAIRMLELSVETEIELDLHDFDQLVQDEWQWKQSFTTSNSTYKSF